MSLLRLVKFFSYCNYFTKKFTCFQRGKSAKNGMNSEFSAVFHKPGMMHSLSPCQPLEIIDFDLRKNLLQVSQNPFPRLFRCACIHLF